MSDTVFKFMTLAELLNMPDETREHAYRRGYRDGYIAGLQDAYPDQEIPRRLWDFWQDTLLEWMKRGEKRFELPPRPGRE